MVRTFMCHPFLEPKAFTDQYDPTTLCCMHSDRVVIGSTLGAIHIHNLLKGTCPPIHHFATVGIPLVINYSERGGFILSLEAKRNDYKVDSKIGSVPCQVNVYYNFMNSNEPQASLHAGYTTAVATSALANYVNQFVSINLPANANVTDIAICNINANIAVAMDTKVSIFALKENECHTPQQKGNLIDFLPILEVESVFKVWSVSLSLNFVGLASKTELRVEQLFVSIPEDEKICQAEDVSQLLESCAIPSNKPERSDTIFSAISEKSEQATPILPSKSTITVDPNYILWNFDQKRGVSDLSGSIDLVSNSHSSTSNDPIFEDGVQYGISLRSIVEETEYIDNGVGRKEVLGPADDIVGHPLHCLMTYSLTNPLTDGSFYATVSHSTLLYRRFEDDDLSVIGGLESIHSLQWLPVFVEASNIADPEVSGTNWPWNLFRMPPNKVLVSHSLFFSTGKEGFLYELHSSPKHIVTYEYTADCLGAMHSKSALYTVTPNGMESYPSRVYANASAQAKALLKDDEAEAILAESDILLQSDEHSHQATLTSSVDHSIPPEEDSVNDQSKVSLIFEEQYFSSYVGTTRKKSTTKDPVQTVIGKIRKLSVSKEPAQPPKEQPIKEMEDVTKFELLSGVAEADSVPTYPTYKASDMLRPCPTSTMEICLLGMYPLRDLSYVGTTSKYVVLLVKALKMKEKKRSSSSDRVAPWRVYALERRKITELSSEVVSLVDGHEFSNPNIYHHLLCESHLILRSELHDANEEYITAEIQKHLQLSATTIADFLLRCGKDFDQKEARAYYKMAGLSFEEVLKRHMECESPDEKKKWSFGPGMIEYLSSYLFEETTDDLEVSQEICDYILKVYLKNQPSQLSTVLMKSRLKNFNNELALKFMDKYKKKQESRGTKLCSFDYICITVLHMRAGHPGEAEDTLKGLSADSLQRSCIENEEFLWSEDGSSLSLLGQVLKRYFISTFLNILVGLYDNGTLTIEKALELFRVQDNENNISHNEHACDFLETLLNDNSRKRQFPTILSALLSQYMSKLTKPSSFNESWKSSHQHMLKGNGHFAPRFSWLNQLAPFSGEVPSPQDCIHKRPQQKQHKSKHLAASNSSSPQGGSPISASSPMALSTSASSSQSHMNTLQNRAYCPCCCCSETLLKIQSLLCSKHNRKDTSSKVLSLLESTSFIGKESLLLLTWPKTGFAKEASEYMVRNYPDSILQYAKEMFDWKAQWELLLQHLLDILRTNDYEQWNQDTYTEALKGVLLRLTRVFTPAEFLQLLPKDGAVQFFLPYLSECSEYHESTKLKQHFLDTFKTIETQVE